MEGLAPLSIRGIVNRKPRALVCKQRLRSKQCSPYPTQEQVILEENWGDKSVVYTWRAASRLENPGEQIET